MKVILLQDIAGVGRKSDVKDVADGFALHYLLPKKLALPATKEVIAQVEHANAQRRAQSEGSKSSLKDFRYALAGKTIIIKKRADVKGNLYAAVSAQDVIAAMKRCGIEMPKNIQLEKIVVFEKPIKSLGAHTITIRGFGEEFTFAIDVVSLLKSR